MYLAEFVYNSPVLTDQHSLVSQCILHQLSAVCITPSSGGLNVKMSHTQPGPGPQQLKLCGRAQVLDNVLGTNALFFNLGNYVVL